MSRIIEDSFSAWINTMPGSSPKLIVKGNAEVPAGGWSGDLVKSDPQGINPDVLILDVVLKQPSGSVIQVVSTIELRYEEGPPSRTYVDVTVRHDDGEFTIPVGEAQ